MLAAMMVTQDSALPQMKRSMPSSRWGVSGRKVGAAGERLTGVHGEHLGDLGRLDDSRDGGAEITVSYHPTPQKKFHTHKTPQLIATATPIFSFLFICSPQINFHGSNASAKSIAAEYPAEKIL